MSDNIILTPVLERVAKRLNLLPQDAQKFYEALKAVVIESLETNRRVEFSNLGSFELLLSNSDGEEGHYILHFFADKAMKQRVNEDFSHLKAVELDETAQPITKLSQQADEIRGLLTDIQGEEIKGKVSTVSEEEQEKKQVKISNNKQDTIRPTTLKTVKSEVAAIVEVEEEHNEISEPNQPVENYANKKGVEFFHRKLETPPEVKANVFDYVPENQEKNRKKKKTWLGVLLTVLILAVAAIFSWYFLKSPLRRTDHDKEIQVIETALVIPDGTIENVTDSFRSDSVVISIFDQTRNYNEFIATSTVKEGNTLAAIAREYYGHTDFWVYIYEANRSIISNPNSLSAGCTIKIPKLDKRLINLKDTACLNYAQTLKNKYLSNR
ncbi:MAG: LysM peptidoglycan-binding domain-containing protein [Prevotellaceae bacterium]|jgi:nucleoid-associated protein YgaU|nr:LysM peptidoglycan-binding domain-containing protein [Prevotellaceae bacterium]